MKFGVIVFPGSNCDEDIVYSLSNIMEQSVVKIWHKETSLKNVDALILPGGVSYSNYLGNGANPIKSPIINEIIKFANNGNFVLGISNGFQLLCELGLLPGGLLKNSNNKFVCKNIYIKASNNNTALTHKCDTSNALKIPIAHLYGKYSSDEETTTKIRENNQILFHYCDPKGNLTKEANPNGSLANIAGVCNYEKNVFGMMPQIERAVDDELGNTDGQIIYPTFRTPNVKKNN